MKQGLPGNKYCVIWLVGIIWKSGCYLLRHASQSGCLTQNVQLQVLGIMWSNMWHFQLHVGSSRHLTQNGCWCVTRHGVIRSMTYLQKNTDMGGYLTQNGCWCAIRHSMIRSMTYLQRNTNLGCHLTQNGCGDGCCCIPLVGIKLHHNTLHTQRPKHLVTG